MYVCVCNAVTESQLHAAISDGHTTHEALQDELGVATCCGTCRETVCEVLTSRCTTEPRFEPRVEATGAADPGATLPLPA